MKKSVLFITPQPFFARRGSPFRVKATVTAIRDLGYEVDLLALPFGTDLPSDGYRLHRGYSIPGIGGIPIGPSWRKCLVDIGLALKAFRLCCSNKYDVIHGIEEGGIIANFLGRFFSIPHIFDMHSHMSDQLLASGFFKAQTLLNWFTKLECLCMRRASAIVTVGSDITEKARKIAPGVGVFSLNDCPLEFPANAEAACELVDRYQLRDSRILIYTGNLEPYQGIDLLLHSYARFIKSGVQGVKLVIIGGGSDSACSLAKYHSLSRELGITDQVVFTGELAPEDVALFVSKADVLVSPRVEGTNTPLKIYSYMASGKPIVATRIVSHTQVLNDDNCVLAAPNENDFAQSLSFVLNPSNSELTAARIKRAEELAATVYSREAFMKTVEDVYKYVFEKPRKAVYIKPGRVDSGPTVETIL